MRRKEAPEINAGSMADIAFLLLIFFLVTTTMEVDQGIFRRIPEKTNESKVTVKEKNLLEVRINQHNKLMVEKEEIDISQLTQLAINFIDNGAGKDREGNHCAWCQGKKDPLSSDHPSKAVIAIESNRNAHYGTYITVLDNLNVAYATLRNRYAKKVYGISYSDLQKEEKRRGGDNSEIRKKILEIQEKYPLLLTDSEIQN
jgi:biopolymer transport protein ExbD